MIGKIKTDCKTDKGIMVGLIDSLITTCRVLAPMVRKDGEDELSEEVLHALKDLTSDKDVLDVLRAVTSRNIISDEHADAWDSIIKNTKNIKVKL